MQASRPHGVVYGRAGDDWLSGDKVFGGPNADRVLGRRMFGGRGADRLGDNSIASDASEAGIGYGGPGDDSLSGQRLVLRRARGRPAV